MKEDRKKKIKESHEPMWFYEEGWMNEECRSIRKEMAAVEREYVELRKELKDTEEKLTIGEDEYLQAKADYIRKRILNLEKKFPWLLSDVPLEALLWGVPHG